MLKSFVLIQFDETVIIKPNNNIKSTHTLSHSNQIMIINHIFYNHPIITSLKSHKCRTPSPSPNQIISNQRSKAILYYYHKTNNTYRTITLILTLIARLTPPEGLLILQTRTILCLFFSWEVPLSFVLLRVCNPIWINELITKSIAYHSITTTITPHHPCALALLLPSLFFAV